MYETTLPMADAAGKFLPFLHVRRRRHPNRAHGSDGRATNNGPADGWRGGSRLRYLSALWKQA